MVSTFQFSDDRVNPGGYRAGRNALPRQIAESSDSLLVPQDACLKQKHRIFDQCRQGLIVKVPPARRLRVTLQGLANLLLGFSALDAVDTVGIDKESQLLKPVLLLAREKDEWALARATLFECVHIVAPREDCVILSSYICRNGRPWENFAARMAPARRSKPQPELVERHPEARGHYFASVSRMGHDVLEFATREYRHNACYGLTNESLSHACMLKGMEEFDAEVSRLAKPKRTERFIGLDSNRERSVHRADAVGGSDPVRR